jgi:hypothetical protein
MISKDEEGVAVEECVFWGQDAKRRMFNIS